MLLTDVGNLISSHQVHQPYLKKHFEFQNKKKYIIIINVILKITMFYLNYNFTSPPANQDTEVKIIFYYIFVVMRLFFSFKEESIGIKLSILKTTVLDNVLFFAVS